MVRLQPGSTLGMHHATTAALAVQVAVNTILGAATDGIRVFLKRFSITRKFDKGGLCNGILGGLVSITAGCGSVECSSTWPGPCCCRSLILTTRWMPALRTASATPWARQQHSLTGARASIITAVGQASVASQRATLTQRAWQAPAAPPSLRSSSWPS